MRSGPKAFQIDENWWNNRFKSVEESKRIWQKMFRFRAIKGLTTMALRSTLGKSKIN